MACIMANDGVAYSDDQYILAGRLVEEHLRRLGKSVSITEWNYWHVTGAIAGFTNDGEPFEFYMRDLVRGIVRERQLGYGEYMAAVKEAGVV